MCRRSGGTSSIRLVGHGGKGPQQAELVWPRLPTPSGTLVHNSVLLKVVLSSYLLSAGVQLVLLNVSDHHTRAKANLEDPSLPPPRVLGCLLGQQTGRVVDVSNSFELVYELTASGLIIDEGLLTKKTEQCESTEYLAQCQITTGGCFAQHSQHTIIAESQPYRCLQISKYSPSWTLLAGTPLVKTFRKLTCSYTERHVCLLCNKSRLTVFCAAIAARPGAYAEPRGCCAQVMELNESPVFLLFHTQQNVIRKDLPVSLYESGKSASGKISAIKSVPNAGPTAHRIPCVL